MKDCYDFVVIGGGSAGYAAASSAARLGMKTAVVEGGSEIGGLCILRGCMPSKTLLESAHRAESIRRAHEFGLNAQYLGADPVAIVARKRALVAEFAEYRQGQLQAGNFDFIRARARFVDPHTLALTGSEGPQSIQSRSFLIATGSRLNRVEIPGLEEVGYWDSDHVLDSTRIPKSIIVLGGGAIGLEFASFYAGVGSEVIVIQRGAHLLKEMDHDVAASLAHAFAKRGIRVLCETAIVRVEADSGRKRVVFYQGGLRREVEAEEIVYALGRRPLVEGLGLEQAGVALDGCGIGVNDQQQTSVPHIFAAGDVCGPFEVVHIAILQGELAARNAARMFQKPTEPLEAIDHRLKLFAVFSMPEVAAVGLTEHEAALQGIDALAACYPFRDHGKALVRGELDGFVKLIVRRDTRSILGASVVGPDASELIHEITVAMHFGATAGDLARIPHYHPTLSEIWTYPAEELA